MNLSDVKPKDKTAPGARVRLLHTGRMWGSASGALGTVRGPAVRMGQDYIKVILDHPDTGGYGAFVYAKEHEYDLV